MKIIIKLLTVFLVMALFTELTLYAQDTVNRQKIYETEMNYASFCPRPDALFLSGKYEEYLQNLQQDTTLPKVIYLYHLASCYAKMGLTDSAFLYLNCYIDISYDDRIIIADNTWNELRKDTAMWQQIIDKIEKLYLQDLNPLCNKELALELFYLGIYDQIYRLYYPVLQQLSDKEDLERGKELINYSQKRFGEILKQYGFPAISLVGLLGSTHAFLLFQHSGFLIRDYHLIASCYQKNEIRPRWYAMATDRYLTDLGKKQIYGSQFTKCNKSEKRYPGKTVLCPVEDFNHINERRKEMGFSSTVEENAERLDGYIPPEYYKGKGKVKWVNPKSFTRYMKEKNKKTK